MTEKYPEQHRVVPEQVPGALNERELESSVDVTDTNGYDRRLSSLERWREAIDFERGQIMRELGEMKGLMEGVGTQMSGVGTQMSDVVRQLEGIREQLEERPSRTEFKETERQIQSIRAKSKVGLLSKLEVTGPGGLSFKLFGVSGVTIVLVFLLIVVIFALWFLRVK